MGLCGSSSLESQLSRQIDRDLARSYREEDSVVKLLLLGAGGSGKSTIMRQFKMLYTSGFDDAERASMAWEIRKNLVQGIQVLVQATRDHEATTSHILSENHRHIDTVFDYYVGQSHAASQQDDEMARRDDRSTRAEQPPSATAAPNARSPDVSNFPPPSAGAPSPSVGDGTPLDSVNPMFKGHAPVQAGAGGESKAETEKLKQLDGGGDDMTRQRSELSQLSTLPDLIGSKSTVWSPELTEACEALLADPAIRSAEGLSSKLQLEDSVRYFRNHVRRVCQQGYVPTDKDIAHVRIRTQGVHPLYFSVGPARFCCVDVGGQRNQRRKWIAKFERVDAVVFVASLAAFDMTLIEERSKNRAEEALELFEELSSSPYFRGTDMILFLNKKDLLEEKLKTVKVADFLHDYEGDNSYGDIVDYFEMLYQDAFRRGQDSLLGLRHDDAAASASALTRPNSLPKKYSDLAKQVKKQMSAAEIRRAKRYSSIEQPAGSGSTNWNTPSPSFAVTLDKKQQEAIRRKQLYVHVTHATDQESIRFTFNACRDIILRDNLRDFL